MYFLSCLISHARWFDSNGVLMCVIPRESKVNSYGCSCDIGAREKITLKKSFKLKWSVQIFLL